MWRSLTFRQSGAVSCEGLSSLLLRPQFLKGVGRTLSAFCIMVNQEVFFFSYRPMLLPIFCFMLHPNLVIIPDMKDAHKLLAGYVLVSASTDWVYRGASIRQYRLMRTICLPGRQCSSSLKCRATSPQKLTPPRHGLPELLTESGVLGAYSSVNSSLSCLPVYQSKAFPLRYLHRLGKNKSTLVYNTVWTP